MTQVLNENGFMNIYNKRANDDYWKSVSSVQTCIRSKIGCGQPIVIHFFAPINEKRPHDTIVYDFRQFGNEENLI